MYHGTPAERAELRRTVMALPSDRPTAKSKKSKAKSKPTPSSSKRSSRPKGPFTKSSHYDISDSDIEVVDKQGPMSSFPVVITTYEMIIRDRVHLAHYNWGYIVVDEGHRLKNLDCRLMQEIKKYTSAGRMILTGTPLHVCAFPSVNSDSYSFAFRITSQSCGHCSILYCLIFLTMWTPSKNGAQSEPAYSLILICLVLLFLRFNLPEMQTNLGSERSSQIIGSLHAILKPFLLRRLKADVEVNLPPKKEYVLYTPLSVQQREAYDRVLEGTLRSYLMGQNPAKQEQKPIEDGPRRLRSSRVNFSRKTYNVDDSDDSDDEHEQEEAKRDSNDAKEQQQRELEQLAKEHQYKSTGISAVSMSRPAHRSRCYLVKGVNNMKLQNTVMQLRKVCSHPFLFDWPLDPSTRQPVINDDLVNASGKMMVLDRLLSELFKRKHKVLLFSQFTTMLDIIEVRYRIDHNKTFPQRQILSIRTGRLNLWAGLFVVLMGQRRLWNAESK